MILTQMSSKHLLWRVGVPSMLGIIFQSGMQLMQASMAMLFDADSAQALAATFPIFFSLLALGRGLSSAASALMGHVVLKQPSQQLSLVVQVIAFAVFMSFVWLFCIEIFSVKLLHALHVAEHNIASDQQFLHWMGWGAPAFILGMVMNGLLIGIGQSKAYQKALMLGLCLEGAWVAWGLSHGFGLVTIPVGFVVVQYSICIWMFSQIRLYFSAEKKVQWRGFWWENIRLSWPVFFAYLLVTLELALLEYLIHYYGTEAILNGFFLGQRMEVIVFTAIIGLGNALIGIIGQHHAIKNYEQIRHLFSKFIQFSLLFVVLCMVLIIGIAVPIIKSHPLNIAMKTTLDYAQYMVPGLMIYPFMMLTMSAFQGVKKPEIVTIVEVIRLTVVRFLVTMGLASSLGLSGIWLSTPVCNMVGAVVFLILWQRYCNFRSRQIAS